MNKWTKESIKLAIETSYLDKLLEIYPPEEIERGLVVEEFSPNLKEIFEKREDEKLIRELVRLKKKKFKFPIEDPYVSMICYSSEITNKNPKTVRKICEKLYNLSYKELKENLEKPKKSSRRMGSMFKNWLKNKYKFEREENFKLINENVVFLKGEDEKLKEFAIREIGCKFKDLTKGLDFLTKVNSKYYILGTAKFITDFGGSQTNQFYEAINFIREVQSPPTVIKVAIVDGIIWFAKGGKIKKEIEKIKDNEFVFSVLLLEKFLKELS